MFLLDLIAAVSVALVFSLILAGLLGWKRPGREGFGSALLFLFFLLAVIVWAGGSWAGPAGPVMWGIAWIPFLTVGFFGTLLIAALVPPRQPRTRREALEQAEAQVGAEATLTAFFWLLVVLLAIAIVVRYV
jgi:vacuolar-type H+-ATPase subunit I/STV1